MKTNNITLVVASLHMFLLLAVFGIQFIAVVKAEPDRTVGVNVGDWATYSVSTPGNSTYMPSEFWNISWVKITVLTITGTNITFETRIGYTNGTEEIGPNGIVDVDTGQGNATGDFIASNLNPGDLIYTSPPEMTWFEGATINETVFRTYLGYPMQTNHLSIAQNYSYLGMNMTWSYNLYWLRASGMLVEMSMEMWYRNQTTTEWWSAFFVITGIIPEFPHALILPLFVILTATIVLILKIVPPTRRPIRKQSLKLQD